MGDSNSRWSGVLEKWRNKPVFVVGKSTEKAAQYLGLDVQGGEAGNAESLLPLMIDAIHDKSRPVLFPCGNLRRETLPQGLLASGFRVEDLMVYETAPLPGIEENLEKIVQNEGAPGYVCFFSPSGVRYSHQALVNLKLTGSIKTISMGPSTSKTMTELNIPPTAQAERPTIDSLAEAVVHARDVSDR